MMASETVFRGHRFRVDRVMQATAAGERARDIVRHPGSVVILPLVSATEVCLIENYRVAVDRRLLELPAGTLEPGENPDACADRELQEETGYRATQIERLHAFYAAPGISDEKMHLFLATGLLPGAAAREAGEEIENRVVPLSEALAMIADERIVDAKTIVGLLYYDVLRRQRGA